jgi:hypothetical protein
MYNIPKKPELQATSRDTIPDNSSLSSSASLSWGLSWWLVLGMTRLSPWPSRFVPDLRELRDVQISCNQLVVYSCILGIWASEHPYTVPERLVPFLKWGTFRRLSPFFVGKLCLLKLSKYFYRAVCKTQHAHACYGLINAHALAWFESSELRSLDKLLSKTTRKWQATVRLWDRRTFDTYPFIQIEERRGDQPGARLSQTFCTIRPTVCSCIDEFAPCIVVTNPMLANFYQAFLDHAWTNGGVSHFGWIQAKDGRVVGEHGDIFLSAE